MNVKIVLVLHLEVSNSFVPLTIFLISALSNDEWMADLCKGWRNLALHSAIQKPVVKMIASTVVILAKLNYKQTQYVDVLRVPRALVKCGSETQHAFF